MDIHKALKLLADKNGSELFITVGYPACLKLNNQITPITKQALTKEQADQAIKSVMDDRRYNNFNKKP